MTRENRAADLARWLVSILAALMFGAFLGSPLPEIWADQISETAAVISEQAAVNERLHKEKAINHASEETSKTDSVNKEDETAAVTAAAIATLPAVELVVSDPPPEDRPDYICLNANRGGVADRKEMDVLVRLINAEAYGLSYKAKVAVGQVVINRWVGPYYGDDLLAIMTAPHQFTPIYDGSAYKKEIEPDSVKAANAVLSGAGVPELTADTYYFCNPDFTEDKTIENEMEFVCEIEGIHFYKPPGR